MRKWFFRILFLAVVGGVAFALWQTFSKRQTLDIREAVASKGPLQLTVSTTGRLSPTTEVTVGSEVSGTVESILVSHNDRVTKGQVIARLKPEMYRAEHEQAKSELARVTAELQRLQVQERESKREFDRINSLFERKVENENAMKVAQAAYDAAVAAAAAGRAMVESAESKVKLTAYRLERSVITAPIDGMVLDKRVDVGQTIAATLQAPVLFVLAEDLVRMQLLADVSEADIGFLHAGQQTSFSVDAFRDQTFPGVVREIRNQPRTVRDVVTYTVVIDVINNDRLLRPGMTADVSVQIVSRPEVLKVANAALRFRPPLSADETRKLLEQVTWPDRPAPVMVEVGLPSATQATDTAPAPPPITPGKATLWTYANGSWKPVGIWTLFTDNRETAIDLDPGVNTDRFVVEATVLVSSRSRFQEAIMLASPKNREGMLTRKK